MRVFETCMLKWTRDGLNFDEDMTCASGDIPIVGTFTRRLSRRKLGEPLEHFPNFYGMKGFIFVFYQHGRDYIFYSIPVLNICDRCRYW